MTMATNAKNLWQYKSRFSLIIEQILAIEKLRICLQISNLFHNNVLYYRQLSFGQIDPFDHKTFMGSAKNKVQIACTQLIELSL